ncbi:MAG: restriction endonuclease subunit S [Defluviitaleaceae bacterium]|nr:restriction endonuclease subunit S [Defluviitaleaceae bacterium]
MIGNDCKVPAIRFEGFEGDWAEQQMSTMFKRIRNAFVGTATPYYVDKDSGYFYLQSNNVKNGQINTETEIFINEDFYEKQKDKLLKTGDMVMVQSGHVGHTAVIPKELNNSAAHALIMFSEAQEGINTYFLNYGFQTSKIKRELAFITIGNTIKHILASGMNVFRVMLPCDKEQTAIGDFFRNLDDTIALKKQQHEKTLNIKKAMLEKMFPKKGATVPEIRFEGFTGAWEQWRLSDALKIRNEAVNSNDYDFDVELENIVSDMGTLIGDTSVRTQAKSLFRKGDTLFGRLRPYLNKWWLADRDGLKSGEIWALIPSASFDEAFAYMIVQSDTFLSHANISSGTKMPRADWSKVSEAVILAPSPAEQTIIGSFFRIIDELAEAQYQELEKLQNIKNACLNKMFV